MSVYSIRSNKYVSSPNLWLQLLSVVLVKSWDDYIGIDYCYMILSVPLVSVLQRDKERILDGKPEISALGSVIELLHLWAWLDTCGSYYYNITYKWFILQLNHLSLTLSPLWFMKEQTIGTTDLKPIL